MPATALSHAGMTWLFVFEYGMCFAAKNFHLRRKFAVKKCLLEWFSKRVFGYKWMQNH